MKKDNQTVIEAAKEFAKLRVDALKNKKEWSPDRIYHEALCGYVAGSVETIEKMYSEEEAIQLLIKFNQEIREVDDVRGWFEQFKKK
jgi:hypothetical protein